MVKGDAGENEWAAYFSSAENWAKFISAFQAMPPEQQKHDFDIMVGLLKEATDDNALKVADYLTSLIDPTAQPGTIGWQTADKAFAGMDAKMVLGGAAAVATGVVMSRLVGPLRLAKLAKKLDNIDLAAKTTEGAIASPEVAKAAGMTQTEAVATASPVKMEHFTQGAPDGVAQKIKLNFEALDAHMELENVRRFGLELTPEQQQAAIAKKIKELEATPDVSDVGVGKITEDGFELTYTVKAPKVQEAVGVDAIPEELVTKLKSAIDTPEEDQLFKDLLYTVQRDRTPPPQVDTFIGGPNPPQRIQSPKEFLDQLDLITGESGGHRQIIEWLINKNPNIVQGLKLVGDPDLRPLGQFDPLRGIINLKLDSARGETALHEILHSTERLLPDELRAPIVEAWAKDALSKYKSLDAAGKEALVSLITSHRGSGRVKLVQDSLKKLGRREAYMFMDPSEYWADVGSVVLSGKFAAIEPGVVARIYRWYREFVDVVVAALGLSKEHPVAKGLDFLLDETKYKKPANQANLLKFEPLAKTRLEVKQGPDTITSTTYHFTRDDIDAGFTTGETGVGAAFNRFISSPNFLFSKDRKSLVNNFSIIVTEQEKARAHFAEAFKQIYKGLGKQSIDKLNMVLAKGRDLEKEYTYAELVGTGILTKNEFVAYANTRHMMDKAFHFKNKEMYDLAVAQGLKEVHLGNGVRDLMKPYDTKESAVAALNQAPDKIAFVPNPIGGTLREVKLDATTLSDYYDRGYRLVRKAKDKYVKGFDDQYYPFALVKSDEVADVPNIILKKREAGYMPIEYKEGLYFVKQAVKGKVGGVDRAVDMKTLRYFNNKQDAEEFAASLSASGDVSKSDLRVVHDRELTRDEYGDELVGVHGGLYTGSRGQDELPFGLDGTKGPKVDPLASMSKYFSNIAQRYPMSKYRLAIQQQWINEAKKSWGLPVKFDGSFEQAKKFIGSNKDLSITERAMAEKAHDHITFQMRIPTDNEREVQTWMRTVAEKIETINLPGSRKVARAIHRFDHTDPIASVRSSAFNLAMGFYNPAPFFVQALGSTVAMTIDPLRVPKHLTSAFALQAMDMMHNQHALDINAGKMVKSLQDKDLPDLKRAWDMSGLKDSAMYGHADYQAMAKGMPVDRGALRKMWDNHTYFYKTGELFNYRYSFSAAFDWWKRQPGNSKRAVDQKAVDEIMARTNTYLLHMSRANRSTAQKGAFSIPTQFTKIFSQFAEAMLGKELTLKEKMTLLMGQGALFGYVGVEPLGQIIDWGLEKAGYKPEDQNEELIAMKRGLVQTALQEWLGINVNVASRGAVAGGFYQTMVEALFEEKGWEVAAGAAGGITGQRSYEAIAALWNLGTVNDHAPPGSDLKDRTWYKALAVMGEMTSHWRAQDVAYEVNTNKLFRDRKGNLVMRRGDINLQTHIAMGAGFQYADLQTVYNAQKNGMKDATRWANKATSYISTVRRLVDVDNPQNEEDREVTNIVWEALMSSESPEGQDKIREIVLERLLNPKTLEEKMVEKRLKDIIGGMTRPYMITDDLLKNYQDRSPPTQQGIE
ncbi:MAG: hypothetical protein AB7I96_11765 [Candidatus Dadabacteria bacterium]